MNPNRLPQEFQDDPPPDPPKEIELGRSLSEQKIDRDASQEYQERKVKEAQMEAASLLVKCPKWVVIGVTAGDHVAPNVEERSYLMKFFDACANADDRTLADFEGLLVKALELVRKQRSEEDG